MTEHVIMLARVMVLVVVTWQFLPEPHIQTEEVTIGSVWDCERAAADLNPNLRAQSAYVVCRETAQPVDHAV